MILFDDTDDLGSNGSDILDLLGEERDKDPRSVYAMRKYSMDATAMQEEREYSVVGIWLTSLHFYVLASDACCCILVYWMKPLRRFCLSSC